MKKIPTIAWVAGVIVVIAILIGIAIRVAPAAVDSIINMAVETVTGQDIGFDLFSGAGNQQVNMDWN